MKRGLDLIELLEERRQGVSSSSLGTALLGEIEYRYDITRGCRQSFFTPVFAQPILACFDFRSGRRTKWHYSSHNGRTTFSSDVGPSSGLDGKGQRSVLWKLQTYLVVLYTVAKPVENGARVLN